MCTFLARINNDKKFVDKCRPIYNSIHIITSIFYVHKKMERLGFQERPWCNGQCVGPLRRRRGLDCPHWSQSGFCGMKPMLNCMCHVTMTESVHAHHGHIADRSPTFVGPAKALAETIHPWMSPWLNSNRKGSVQCILPVYLMSLWLVRRIRLCTVCVNSHVSDDRAKLYRASYYVCMCNTVC